MPMCEFVCVCLSVSAYSYEFVCEDGYVKGLQQLTIQSCLSVCLCVTSETKLRCVLTSIQIKVYPTTKRYFQIIYISKQTGHQSNNSKKKNLLHTLAHSHANPHTHTRTHTHTNTDTHKRTHIHTHITTRQLHSR
jgi:hypothetical protein